MYLDKIYINKGIFAEIKPVSALYVIAFFKKIHKHLKK